MKIMLTICGRLLDFTYVDMTFRTSQWSRKIVARCVVVISLLGTGRVRLEYWTAEILTY